MFPATCPQHWHPASTRPCVCVCVRSVALFSKASHPTTWPVIMRGADNQITRVSVWSLNVTDQASADLLAYALTAQDRTVDLILGNSSERRHTFATHKARMRNKECAR